jgi:hypothetical protein
MTSERIEISCRVLYVGPDMVAPVLDIFPPMPNLVKQCDYMAAEMKEIC